MQILGILFYLAAFAGSLIVIIHAFKAEVWKGILSLLCGLYWLYYAFAEFQHEKKWPIVIGTIVLWVLGAGATTIGTAASVMR